MPLDPALLRRPALVSSLLAPVIFIGGTITAELAWPAFEPVRQTISELAAGDAPTRVFMTLVFLLTGVCHLMTASFATGIGRPGRVALFMAGLSTLGVAAFPLPTVAGTSAEHRIAAMIGFILLAAWPLLGMRVPRRFPLILRPLGATLSTAVLAALCLAFLSVWSSTDLGTVGLVERLAADAESVFPALVVLALWRRARHPAPVDNPSPMSEAAA